MTRCIYRLDSVDDDPRFSGFDGDPIHLEYSKYVAGERIPSIRRLADGWKPMRVTGKVREFNHYPCLGFRPILSKYAVEALRDMLEPNGELLPLSADRGEYFAYNVHNICDCLDESRSEVRWLRPGIIAMHITKFEFDPNQLGDAEVFTIPQLMSAVFVSQSFVDRATAAGLYGMSFHRVWPTQSALPPGKTGKKASKKGLVIDLVPPAGKKVKSAWSATAESCVVELLKPTSAVSKKALSKFQKLLDKRLMPAGTDFASGALTGEFDEGKYTRFIFSCPDSAVFGKELAEMITEAAPLLLRRVIARRCPADVIHPRRGEVTVILSNRTGARRGRG